jgi:hypothetical protein
MVAEIEESTALCSVIADKSRALDAERRIMREDVERKFEAVELKRQVCRKTRHFPVCEIANGIQSGVAITQCKPYSSLYRPCLESTTLNRKAAGRFGAAQRAAQGSATSKTATTACKGCG